MTTPYAHAVRHAFEHSKSMRPVAAGKSPILGFLIGFALGPVGVGLYLKSMPDFLITLALVVVGSMLSAGLGAPVFWMLCGAWAAVRVNQSNNTPPSSPPAAPATGPDPADPAPPVPASAAAFPISAASTIPLADASGKAPWGSAFASRPPLAT